jgi:hypothetical protein
MRPPARGPFGGRGGGGGRPGRGGPTVTEYLLITAVLVVAIVQAVAHFFPKPFQAGTEYLGRQVKEMFRGLYDGDSRDRR